MIRVLNQSQLIADVLEWNTIGFAVWLLCKIIRQAGNHSRKPFPRRALDKWFRVLPL